MGAWPFNEIREANGEEPKYIPLRHYKFLLVFWSTMFLNSLCYLKLNIDTLDFFKLGQVYIVIFMNAVAMVSSLTYYYTYLTYFILKC